MVEWKWIAPIEINPVKNLVLSRKRKEKGSDVPQIFRLLWYFASPTPHFVKQFVSFLSFLSTSIESDEHFCEAHREC